MSLIIIIIAYYFDYKVDKKQFIQDLLGGLSFCLLLVLIFVFMKFVLNLGFLYTIFMVGGVIFPISLLVKQVFRKG